MGREDRRCRRRQEKTLYTDRDASANRLRGNKVNRQTYTDKTNSQRWIYSAAPASHDDGTAEQPPPLFSKAQTFAENSAGVRVATDEMQNSRGRTCAKGRLDIKRPLSLKKSLLQFNQYFKFKFISKIPYYDVTFKLSQFTIFQ